MAADLTRPETPIRDDFACRRDALLGDGGRCLTGEDPSKPLR